MATTEPSPFHEAMAQVDRLKAENERLRAGLLAAASTSTIFLSRLRRAKANGEDDHMLAITEERHKVAYEALYGSAGRCPA